MLFNSITFLYWFLPLCLLLYYLFPGKIKNWILLIFSLVFYAWGGVSYSLVLIVSIIFNYLFAKQITAGQKKKLWLSIGLIFNIIGLFIFKYLNFLIENTNSILSTFLPEDEFFKSVKIVLPLGISFFTFQEMSMLWDIYKSEKKEKINFLQTALYVSFFPQLIAGPIVRYHDIIDSIKNRSHQAPLFVSGIQKFALGLFKKVIIANTCAVITDEILSYPIELIGFQTTWLAFIAYSFQIYFDFSGYSDMAIGLGRMFGFKINENFNFPYIACSIQEFWHRWHISLSTWFRDYVYIPLGGSHEGKIKTYRNLILVFLLTGFWHGATWSFVFWGAFHGFFLLMERIGLGKLLKRLPRPIAWIYTMLVVIIGWVYFRIEDFSVANLFVMNLLNPFQTGTLNVLQVLDFEKLTIIALAMLASSNVFNWIKINLERIFASSFDILKTLAAIALIIFCTLYINANSYSPFIYFRF